jgi:hypothetical protein
MSYQRSSTYEPGKLHLYLSDQYWDHPDLDELWENERLNCKNDGTRTNCPLICVFFIVMIIVWYPCYRYDICVGV